MIDLLLEAGGLNVPWPVRLPNGTIVPGAMGINQICENKCNSKSCFQSRSSLIGTRCEHGLTCYEGLIDNILIKVFGVVGPAHRESLPKHKDYKLACKGRSVTARDFSDWMQKIKYSFLILQDEQNKIMAEALEPLHDAMRLAKDVQQLVEKTLFENTSSDCTDAFGSATPTLKALLKTSVLLVDTFDLLEIYLNPESASFGQPRTVEIYKLLDKLSRIASLARQIERKPKVKLVGNTRKAFDVYESFKLIPITLIDNAQKYSRQDGEVIITIDEDGSSLEISITSEGAWLSPDDLDSIFTRGFRGSAAQTIYPSGMGLGLYIAQTVADAHGFKIKASSVKLGYQLDGFQQAKNIFSFTIRDVLPRMR